ncbi:hypothetical protein [Phage f2b1]|nr:hypothetical protein [Phage f2b1]
MEYGVYLETSVVNLKPNVLAFLTKMVDKAKEVKDFAIAFKKKELAELGGKDSRTVSRYLKVLEEKEIIQTKGVRGRAGGTVVMFNTDLIRFDTSDKALINEENVSIEDIAKRKLPKKEKEPKKNSRNRRTKQQMLQDKLLRGEKQAKLDEMHSKLHDLGGVPNWEWFKETDNPVGNYRTYLLSRLYNRYAVLFTDRHNAEVNVYGEGSPIKPLTNDYDCLPADFYGSSRWVQFEKFRLFCEEQQLDPATYLSAQFNRSIFTANGKSQQKALPFINALMSDGSYEAYRQYCAYQKQVSYAYAAYGEIPIKFGDDVVVRALVEAYDTADSGVGLLQYKHAIQDFLTGTGSGEKEVALVNFYRMTEDNLLNKNVSFKTRNTIKKFLLTQSMILTGGISSLPGYYIFGSEHTQVVLGSIKKLANSAYEQTTLEKRALGLLALPTADEDKQMEVGANYRYQLDVLDETRQVLNLIMDRKGLYISLADLQEAFKEYGKEMIPLDDYSVLDTDKIVKFINSQGEQETPEEFNYDEIVTKRTYKIYGGDSGADLENTLQDFMRS